MFGRIAHKHTPMRDNRMEPNMMVCSDPNCNALLGPAPISKEEIIEEMNEEPEPEVPTKMEQILPKTVVAARPKPQPKHEQIELTKEQVLEMAIKKWGPSLQLNQTIQEAAELIKELTDSLRGQQNTEKVSEEVADLEIMLSQLKMIYNNKEQVKQFKLAKLQRLAEILLAQSPSEKSEPEDEE